MNQFAFGPQTYIWKMGNSKRPSSSFARIGQENGYTLESPKMRNPTRRHFVGGVIFIVFSLALFAYWAAFPLLNTQFFYGTARLGSPSAEPRSARYGWDWWTIWLLTLNGLPPLLLAMALAENKIQEYARAHGFICAILLLVNLWCFVTFSIRWCAFCNRAGTPGSTACNDYRYCCVYFGASVENTHWCPNAIPCSPSVTSSQLYRNSEYFQHWLFSILFFIMAFWHLGVQKSLADFRIFSSQDEQPE